MSSKYVFLAEIKEVKATKAVSNDIIYRLVVVSDDPTVNSLGLLDGETLVKLTIEVVNEYTV